jgi:hypothetical protein
MNTSNMSSIPFRPLGEILEIVQQIGFDITYAYDDLLFSNHHVFIIRFDAAIQNRIWLHFNQDCQSKERISIQEKLRKACTKKFDLQEGSLFLAKQIEGKEEIELRFF